jgi:hypothetical protein
MGYSSVDPQVHGRRLAVAATFDLVRNLLAFTKIAESRALDGRDVHKHVVSTLVGLDESITLLRVEPFDGAGSHS